jgi:hypothetical protein
MKQQKTHHLKSQGSSLTGVSFKDVLKVHQMVLHISEDKPRQDKTRQDKTKQDKTRQDKTRQDKTRQIMMITDSGTTTKTTCCA